jgi:hypothetical protein
MGKSVDRKSVGMNIRRCKKMKVNVDDSSIEGSLRDEREALLCDRGQLMVTAVSQRFLAVI